MTDLNGHADKPSGNAPGALSIDRLDAWH